MNLLITSVSRKIPLIKALRRVLQGELIGGDSDPMALGRYFVDRFWQMPMLEKLSYRDLLAFCKCNQIKVIIPTRDGELLFFASHQGSLKKEGIWVMVSPQEATAVCLDKLLFYQTLKKWGYPAVQTALLLDELQADLYVVKERFGSGSRDLLLNASREEAIRFAADLKAPLFQPYLEGKEYSVDLYVDQRGSSRGAVVRLRELVVSGESQVTVTVHHPALEAIACEVAEKIGLFGHVLFQVIEWEGKCYFLECNPRFGGASTLSLSVGLDTLAWFLDEVEGRQLPPFSRTKEEKRLVRYPEDWIVE